MEVFNAGTPVWAQVFGCWRRVRVEKIKLDGVTAVVRFYVGQQERRRPRRLTDLKPAEWVPDGPAGPEDWPPR